uniref:Uncharacterized protein n=1 Tax=Brassica oleracea var. oleracea TaxID=109376 RepID=A0A0D3BH84_BRAOL
MSFFFIYGLILLYHSGSAGRGFVELVVVSLNTEEARRGGGGASCLCSPESEDNASW